MKRNRVVLIVLILILTVQVSFADARPLAEDFPTRSVIIGSYVIDYKSLNPKTISIAEETVETTNQKKTYYKSDLTSKKVWVDISTGENITDISDQSPNIVSNAVVDALPLTHWIQADGSVVVFATGEVKSINDMHSLLDPRANELLQKLSIDYDLAKNLFDADEDDTLSEATQNILKPVLLPLEPSVIEVYDKQLGSWDDFSTYLEANGGSEAELLIVSAEKGITFTNREIAVNNALLERLNHAADSAVKKGLNDLNGDLWEAIGKVEASVTTLEESIPSDESSTLASYRGVQEKEMLQAITSEDYKTGMVALEKILHTDHISSGLILDKSAELEILNLAFGESADEIKSIAAEGKGEAYDTALENGESAATLKVLIEAQVEKLKEAISEFQLIVDNITARLDQLEAQQTVLDEAIKAISTALEAVPEETDAIDSTGVDVSGTSVNAEASLVSTQLPADLLTSSMEALEEQLNLIKAINDPDTTEQMAYLEALKTKNDNLYKAFLGALENNDTALADEIKFNMSVIASQQEALYNSFAGLYKEANEGIADLKDQIAENDKQLQTAEEPAITELNKATETLESQISKLKEDLAKFALLIDPTDKALLGMYQEALNEVKSNIASGEIDAAETALDNVLTLFTVLPDSLKSEGDFKVLTSLLIKTSKEAYLMNLAEQGDALLALTAQITPEQIEVLLAEGTGQSTEPGAGTNDANDTNVDSTDENMAETAQTPSMTINQNASGEYILARVPTIEMEGTIYVPVKTFYNLFGIEVLWHPETKSVEVKGLMQTEVFIQNSKVVQKDNVSTVMDYPMKIIDGVSYVSMAYYTTDIQNFIMPNRLGLTLIIIPLN